MSIPKLVVDANAFIKCYPLEELSQQVYTIPEVRREIRDAATRKRLEFTPYELLLEEPSDESVKRATEFSRKTGDYASLSLVDIKLIALAIELYESDGGSAVEFKESKVQTVLGSGASAPNPSSENETSNTNLPVGFHMPNSNKESGVEGSQFEDVEEEEESGDSEGDEESDDAEGEKSEEDEDSDDGGWITPSNYKPKVQTSTAPTSSVAVLSTDFAVQNVILHTNIPLVSPYGQRITALRSYVLRCYACFETTTQFERKFCGRCGNKTLRKVSVSVQDGKMKLHFSKRFTITPRGKKFSLPTPQGGKYGVNPILTEDQHVTRMRRSKKAVAREIGPFAMNDVSTRSFMVQGQSSHYWDTRNPNEVKRGKGQGRKRNN